MLSALMSPAGPQFDVIVVGGGASGLIAAGHAAERKKRVLLIEKNKRLGEKLRISGGGRCNITNAEYDTRVLLQHYGKAEQALYSLFSQFGVKDTFSFFESHGLPLVVEARKRAFPQSERALDVVRTLETYVQSEGVEILCGAPVTDVSATKEGIQSVSVGSNTYFAKEFIFSTGGVSHPETGSTGDGFLWLKKIGHSVVKPTPTIVPIKTEEVWSKKLAGVSLSPMKITFFTERKKLFAEEGGVLFTHFGLSGPLILNCAHKVADALHSGAVTAAIDAYPKTDAGALEKNILATFDVHKNKSLKNCVNDFVPDGMGRGILLLLSEQIDISKKVHSVSKDERKYIAKTLKALPLTVSGLMGFDRAVVADGGVPLAEIDTRTMRSKRVPNLFVIGDLLHINRPSGGFSLQLCWSTGYVAGEHC